MASPRRFVDPVRAKALSMTGGIQADTHVRVEDMPSFYRFPELWAILAVFSKIYPELDA